MCSPIPVEEKSGSVYSNELILVVTGKWFIWLLILGPVEGGTCVK